MSNPKAVIRTWVDAFNRGDAEALAALYAEDAVNLSPEELVQNGRFLIPR